MLKLSKRFSFVAFLISAPTIFFILNSVNIDAVGLYYDELHQATGSFSYIGKETPFFSLFKVEGIPLFNMHYSGAIKTAFYGLYLSFIGSEFSVDSWRALGILMPSLGLMVFIALSFRFLLSIPLALILFFIITDASVLLCTRYDWGPVALSFMIRIIMIGVFLRWEFSGSASALYPFFLGLLLGLAVYEKLSSVVLILPILIMLLNERSRSRRNFAHAFAGFLMGASILVSSNLFTLVSDQTFFSLQNKGETPQRSWDSFVAYIESVLALGVGADAQRWILGTDPGSKLVIFERVILILLLFAASFLTWLHRQHRYARTSFCALLSYVTIMLAVYLLPRGTWIHHWILATPFQYIAFGLTAGMIFSDNSRTFISKLLRASFSALLVALISIRIFNVASVIDAYAAGSQTVTWSKDKTDLGLFANSRKDDSVFIAADWGVATQIYSLSNGELGFVHEVFWNYKGAADLLALRNKYTSKSFYVVGLAPSTSVNPENTRRIFNDFRNSGHWSEAGLEPEYRALKSIRVEKFVWRE